MSEVTVTQERSTTDDRNQFLAFVSDDDTRAVVEQVVRDLVMPHATVNKGGIRGAVDTLSEHRSPRILLVDISNREMPLSDINELAEVCEPGVTVIAIGDRNDVGLFRELINNGISDYLVKPITPPLLQKSILNTVDGDARTRQTSRLGRLVSVVGSRGGVGSTMLATGIAAHISQRRRRRVALLDLDLQMGSVALALDLEPCHGFREALENPARIDSLYVERTMVRHSDTLHVLSGEENLDMPVFVDPTAVDLLTSELRGKFHFVIADLPRQFSANGAKIFEETSNVVIVTDLSLAGMRDTLRLIQLSSAANSAAQIMIVANRVGEHKQGEIARGEFEKGINRKIDFVVPFDTKTVASAINVGQPVTQSGGLVSKRIEEITEHLVGNTARTKPSLLRRLIPSRK